MKLKIVSDGTVIGTRVEDESGRMIEGVQDVMWYASVDGTVVVKLTVKGVTAEVVGEEMKE